MPISVMPYRSRIAWPVTMCHQSNTCCGRGAEPQTISLPHKHASVVKHILNETILLTKLKMLIANINVYFSEITVDFKA